MIVYSGPRISLDEFLKVVQASDLTALSETLNDDLLELIRQLLA